MKLQEAAKAFVEKHEAQIKQTLHTDNFNKQQAEKIVIDFAQRYMIQKGMKSFAGSGITKDIIGSIWNEMASKEEKTRAEKEGKIAGKALAKKLLNITKAAVGYHSWAKTNEEAKMTPEQYVIYKTKEMSEK